MSGERIAWIDICKGIAISLVVVGHISSIFKYEGILYFLHVFVYSFHMPLFFAISGMLMYKALHTASLKRELEKKIIEYGIPYIFGPLLVRKVPGKWICK